MSRWVNIPASLSATHPKFGVKGLAKFLSVMLVLTPALWLMSAIGRLPEIIDARGALMAADYSLLIPPIALLLWSGWNAHLLGKHDSRFFPSFYAFLALGPIIIVVFRLFWMANAGLQLNVQAVATGFLSFLAGWAFWSSVMIAYVMLSKRVNVTLRNRVRHTDAVLGKV
jgi:hypothetical protein